MNSKMQQTVASVVDSSTELWGISEEQENHVTHDDDNAANVNSGQSSKPQMDPKKLKRIMSNRISAQKSRMKKIQYVEDMESQAKFFQNQIAMLHPQIAASRDQKKLLIWEQRTLNEQLAIQEKECMLRQAKIATKKAEIQSLRELYMIQQRQFQEQATRSEWDASISNSSSHFGLGQMAYQDSNQGQSGEKASMQVDMAPNGNQTLVPGWENICEVIDRKPKLSCSQLQGIMSYSATISEFHNQFI